MPTQALQKIVTRFYRPLTIQAWYFGATRGLEAVIGAGFSDLIAKFDGRKVEVYRLAQELKGEIKNAMLAYAHNELFGSHIEEYKNLIKAYNEALQRQDIREAMRLIEVIYPLFAVSFFVPNVWVDEIEPSRKENVIKLCTAYRELSDGMFNTFDAMAASFFESEQQSSFSVLSLDNVFTENTDLKKGYVFSKNNFYTISWEDFLKKHDFSFEETNIVEAAEIKGIVAFKGKVKGTVKIVFSPNEFDKVEAGDIVVTAMTQPTFSPILEKAAAVITDEGGITCHAAIIARELQKPCIIGTKIATQVFKDGDMVEVDAEQATGTIRIIND